MFDKISALFFVVSRAYFGSFGGC